MELSEYEDETSHKEKILDRSLSLQLSLSSPVSSNGESFRISAYQSEVSTTDGSVNTTTNRKTISELSPSRLSMLSTTPQFSSSFNDNSAALDQLKSNRSRSATVTSLSRMKAFQRNGSIGDINHSNPTINTLRSIIGDGARSRGSSFSRKATALSPQELMNIALFNSNSATNLASSGNIKASSDNDGIVSPIQDKLVDVSFDQLGKGLLKDVQALGFIAVMSHPITRLYYFMFLLHNRLHPLFFFKLDVSEFRQTFYKSTPSQRHMAAYKLYVNYLAPESALMDISKCIISLNETKKVIYDKIIIFITQTLTSPADTIFNDLESIVTVALKSTFASNSEASKATENNQMPIFQQSAAYQAMLSDYNTCTTFSSLHLDRIIQRVLDIPPSTQKDITSRLSALLDQMKYDYHKFPGASKLFQVAETESFGFMSISLRKTKKLQSNNSLVELQKSNSSADLASIGENGSPKLKRTGVKTNPISTAAFVSNSSIDEHPFVVVQEHSSGLFCEYCFKGFGIDGTDKHVYRCEICKYVCHKGCRNLLTLSCFKLSSNQGEDQIDESRSSSHETVLKVLQRYSSLQKELSVSENIRDGMERMVKAKDEINKSLLSIRFRDKKEKSSTSSGGGSGSGGNPLNGQIAQTNSKIEFLKTDLEKCRSRLAGLLSAPENLEFIRSEFYLSVDPSLKTSADELLGKMPATLPIRIFMSTDLSTSPNRTRKSILVDSDMTAGEVIRTSLEKDRRRGMIKINDPEYYNLCFEDKFGTDRIMKKNDKPIIVQHILKECSFFLEPNRVISEKLSFDEHLVSQKSQRDDLEKMAEKRKAVIHEMAETETKYSENLTNALIYYYAPMSKTNIFSKVLLSNIFGNMKELITCHEGIVKSFLSRIKDDPESKGKFMDIYVEVAHTMSSIYVTYCGNQHNAQRTFSKLKEDQSMLKLIEDLQNEPRLARLGLGDLLIQPMHRITRLPILLKRLLSYTPENHPDYTWITSAIYEFEKIATTVNDVVKSKENEFRIRHFQQNLDWSGQCEMFPIAIDGRSLIFEKPFSCIIPGKKQTVDVLTLVFSDMVMISQVNKRKDGSEEFILFRQPIFLTNLAVITSNPTISMTGQQEESKPRHLFHLMNLDREITTLEAFSNTDKISWIQQVESLAYRLCHREISQWFNWTSDLNELESRLIALQNLQISKPPNVLSSLFALSQTPPKNQDDQQLQEYEEDESRPVSLRDTKQLSRTETSISPVPIPPSRSSSITDLAAEDTAPTATLKEHLKKTTASLKDLFKRDKQGVVQSIQAPSLPPRKGDAPQRLRNISKSSFTNLE